MATKKTTNNKKDFIDKLMSMTHQEINDFIKNNGKIKPCIMCRIIDKNNNDGSKCT